MACIGMEWVRGLNRKIVPHRKILRKIVVYIWYWWHVTMGIPFVTINVCQYQIICSMGGDGDVQSGRRHERLRPLTPIDTVKRVRYAGNA